MWYTTSFLQRTLYKRWHFTDIIASDLLNHRENRIRAALHVHIYIGLTLFEVYGCLRKKNQFINIIIASRLNIRKPPPKHNSFAWNMKYILRFVMSKYNWIDLSGSITFGLHETFKWAPSGPKKNKAWVIPLSKIIQFLNLVSFYEFSLFFTCKNWLTYFWEVAFWNQWLNCLRSNLSFFE